MSLKSRLEGNKGTVSNALSKKIAEEVLKGNEKLIEEAANLLNDNNKNIRASAAAILQIVGENKVELIVQHTNSILKALDSPEPQTRWSCLYTLGLCAKHDTKTALLGYEFANKFLFEDTGICLWGRSIDYLGLIGSASPEYGDKAVKVLSVVLDQVPKLSKRTLAALKKIADVGNIRAKEIIDGRKNNPCL